VSGTEPEPAEPETAAPGTSGLETTGPDTAGPDTTEPGQFGAGDGEFVPGLSAPSISLDYLVGAQRRRSRRFAAVAGSVIAIAIVAALLAVALPGGHHDRSGAELTAAEVVASAAQREAGLQTYTASIREQVSGSGSATISGTIKFQRSPLEVATNLTETASGVTIPVSAVVTAKAMYVKLPSSAGLPAAMASKWLKLPLIKPGGTSPLAGIEQEFQRDNPLSQTAMFAAAEHLLDAGPQVVDGVSTTKYIGSVTAAQAVKSLPAAQRSELAPYLRLVTGKIPIELWIDGQGNIRKVQVTEHVGADTATTTITFLTFNQPVSIATPPASQIYVVPQSDMTD
jgi:hypothetical protein